MAKYGVQYTGFVRKPLAVILAEIESGIEETFEEDVIQTPQSPIGQINGVYAEEVSKLWELAEDVYQSHDPDQAEGPRLDSLGKLRLIERGPLEDSNLRQAITNTDEPRIDIQDLDAALKTLKGVTYTKIIVNDGAVSVVIIGGDDSDIAAAIRSKILPGINTVGNHEIISNINGYCRYTYIIRPEEVPIKLTLTLRADKSNNICPVPSEVAIKAGVTNEWKATRTTGLNISDFSLRRIIERKYDNLEYVSFVVEVGETTYNDNVEISLYQIASIEEKDITVTFVT